MNGGFELVPKYTSYELAFADAPHDSVVRLVALKLCPLLGEINENPPGPLQLCCTEKDHIPAVKVSEPSQLTSATTFQK